MLGRKRLQPRTRRPASTTSQPSVASAVAAAAPTPLPAPVTTAILLPIEVPLIRLVNDVRMQIAILGTGPVGRALGRALSAPVMRS